VGKTRRNEACSRRLADRLWTPVGLICALVLVSGCGAATEEVVVTSTVTSTQTGLRLAAAADCFRASWPTGEEDRALADPQAPRPGPARGLVGNGAVNRSCGAQALPAHHAQAHTHPTAGSQTRWLGSAPYPVTVLRYAPQAPGMLSAAAIPRRPGPRSSGRT